MCKFIQCFRSLQISPVYFCLIYAICERFNLWLPKNTRKYSFLAGKPTKRLRKVKEIYIYIVILLLFIIFAEDLLLLLQISMAYENCEEFRRADIIIDAVCKVGGISYFQLLNAPKETTISTLRGVCCVVAWEYNIHARRLARLIHRTRGNVLNQTKKYRGFLQAKDQLTVDIYNKVKAEIGKSYDIYKTRKEGQ